MNQFHSGDRCPKCGNGRLRVRSSWLKAAVLQMRRLHCTVCDHREHESVPAELIHRRAVS